MRVLVTAVLVLAGLAPATAAASATAAATSPCDPLCQQRENALPRTAFYHPPEPLPPRPPGTLIRTEAFAGYRVDGAPVAATRMLYHGSSRAAGRSSPRTTPDSAPVVGPSS